jgi:hypothetical protein
LYQVFDNFRNSRNRRRARIADTRRGSRHSSYDTSNSDEGSVTSVDFAEYRLDETDDEFPSSSVSSRGSSGHRRSIKLPSFLHLVFFFFLCSIQLWSSSFLIMIICIIFFGGHWAQNRCTFATIQGLIYKSVGNN